MSSFFDDETILILLAAILVPGLVMAGISHIPEVVAWLAHIGILAHHPVIPIADGIGLDWPRLILLAVIIALFMLWGSTRKKNR